MIKQQLITILIIFPLTTYADSFVDMGLGISKSNVSEEKLFDGLSGFAELDKTGQVATLSLGHTFSGGFSLAIQYVNFLETLDLDNGFAEQETYSYGLAASLELFQYEQVRVEGGIGYEKWYSKIHLPQGRWEGSTLIYEDTELFGNGYSPFISLNVHSQANKNLVIGFKYEHHYQLGETESLVDRDKLAIGDLVGSIRIDSPLDYSVDLYAVYFRWYF